MTGGGRRHRVVLERPDGEIVFDADEEEYLLYSLMNAGHDSPHICEQGWCLACATRLIEGRVDASDALTHYPEDDAAGFVLMCSARPLSDLRLSQHPSQTRREMTQQRIELNQLARAYPPGKRSTFRRGPRLQASSDIE